MGLESFHKYTPDFTKEKKNQITVYIWTAWLELIIFTSTFKWSLMLSTTDCAQGRWMYSIWYIFCSFQVYCNISYQILCKNVPVKRRSHDDENKVAEKWWQGEMLSILHATIILSAFPPGMDSRVIMLAGCHTDKYSSFLLSFIWLPLPHTWRDSIASVCDGEAHNEQSQVLIVKLHFFYSADISIFIYRPVC